MPTLPRIFRLGTVATLWVAKVEVALSECRLKTQKSLILNDFTLSLCAKVKPFGFTWAYMYMGTHIHTWASVTTPKSTPIFVENCPHTQTPIRAQSPTRHGYCAPIMRAW